MEEQIESGAAVQTAAQETAAAVSEPAPAGTADGTAAGTQSAAAAAETAAAPAETAAAPAADAAREAFRARLRRELAEIHALDPRVERVEDLPRMECFPAFRSLVGRGYSFLDAYKLANFDSFRQSAARAARQTALNAESKGHLTRTLSRGTGAESVPPEVMEQYRLFNPTATEAEISAHYNRSRNH